MPRTDPDCSPEVQQGAPQPVGFSGGWARMDQIASRPRYLIPNRRPRPPAFRFWGSRWLSRFAKTCSPPQPPPRRAQQLFGHALGSDEYRWGAEKKRADHTVFALDMTHSPHSRSRRSALDKGVEVVYNRLTSAGGATGRGARSTTAPAQGLTGFATVATFAHGSEHGDSSPRMRATALNTTNRVTRLAETA